MRCLQSMCGVTRLDRLRNGEVRKSAGVPKNLSKRVDRKVLINMAWACERMGGERLTKRVYMSEVLGGGEQGGDGGHP